MNKKNINVSIAIPTYKPNDILIKSLNRLLNQNCSFNKILIINSNENSFFENFTDNNILEFNNLLKSNNIQIVHIKKEDFKHSKTRNFAFDLLNDDYVLFMTQDALPYDDYLIDNLYNKMMIKNVGVCYGRQIAYENSKYSEKLVREFNYPTYDIVKKKNTVNKYNIKNYFSSNVCSMYNSKIFNAIGRFDEKLDFNEDMVYSYKLINAGYDLYYCSNAIVYHSHNYNYIEQYKRNFLIGKSQKQYDYIFNKLSNENEGIKLFKYVEFNLIKKCKILSAIDFFIETIFRYLGFINGKRYLND